MGDINFDLRFIYSVHCSDQKNIFKKSFVCQGLFKTTLLLHLILALWVNSLSEWWESVMWVSEGGVTWLCSAAEIISTELSWRHTDLLCFWYADVRVHADYVFLCLLPLCCGEPSSCINDVSIKSSSITPTPIFNLDASLCLCVFALCHSSSIIYHASLSGQGLCVRPAFASR